MDLGIPVANYPRRYLRRATCVCVLGFGLATVAYLNVSKPNWPRNSMLTTLSNGTASLELGTKKGPRAAECIKKQGGSCDIVTCRKPTHAVCANSMCVCPSGMCVSPDGTCYSGNYKRLASGVKIKSVMMPSYSLYFPTNGSRSQLGIHDSTHKDDYDDELDLFVLPGKLEHIWTSVLVSSKRQPDYVAYVQSTYPEGDSHPVKKNRVDHLGYMPLAATVLCKPFNAAQGEYRLGTGYAWWAASGDERIVDSPYADLYANQNPRHNWLLWTFDPPIEDTLTELGVTLSGCERPV